MIFFQGDNPEGMRVEPIFDDIEVEDDEEQKDVFAVSLH